MLKIAAPTPRQPHSTSAADKGVLVADGVGRGQENCRIKQEPGRTLPQHLPYDAITRVG